MIIGESILTKYILPEEKLRVYSLAQDKKKNLVGAST